VEACEIRKSVCVSSHAAPVGVPSIVYIVPPPPVALPGSSAPTSPPFCATDPVSPETVPPNGPYTTSIVAALPGSIDSTELRRHRPTPAGFPQR
jgi:hypothetical protein